MNTKQKNLKFCVYCHTNKHNGKRYIGQTCDVQDRWRGNGKNYFSSAKFYNAIQKYGWDGFEHEVLYENLTLDEANELEAKLIEKYNTIVNGYNIKNGGENTPLSEESRRKISDSLKKGYIEHPERREKISKNRSDYTMSASHRRKISRANKGRPHITHWVSIMFHNINYSKAEFSRHLGYSNADKITRFIKRFGFDQFIEFINKYENFETLKPEFLKVLPSNSITRHVLQLDLNGNLIKEWKSAAQVQRETKDMWIYEHLKNGTDGKFLWKYKNF